MLPPPMNYILCQISTCGIAFTTDSLHEVQNVVVHDDLHTVISLDCWNTLTVSSVSNTLHMVSSQNGELLPLLGLAYVRLWMYTNHWRFSHISTSKLSNYHSGSAMLHIISRPLYIWTVWIKGVKLQVVSSLLFFVFLSLSLYPGLCIPFKCITSGAAHAGMGI